MTSPLRIALAGLGTVGTGVVRILQTHPDLIAARAGRPIDIVAVSARSRGKDRGVDISGYRWEDDPVGLASAMDVDVFVEAMGGEDGPALVSTRNALAAGKHVVSANKALLAHHGQELCEKAEAANLALRYEAAVAGGIPVIKALAEGLAGNGMTRVSGVMNGTCNYILTEMERSGADYAKVLSDAQRLGYAEADPAFDVGGIDAAHKLALLASIAFGTKIDFAGIAIEGIERISLADIRHAKDMGFRIKLLGVARMTSDGLEQRMQPCLVPEGSVLGQLDGVVNAVCLRGDFVNDVSLLGPGAGEGPTASAVVGDIIDIARGLIIPPLGIPASHLRTSPRADDSVPAPFYVRLQLRDAPGTLAPVADVLGRHGVSIDRMRQYGHEGEIAPLLIVTHRTTRAAIDVALRDVAALPVSLAEPVALRIEAD